MIMEDNRVADYFIVAGLSENHRSNTQSKQLIRSQLPITDITVIFKSLGEECPIGYTCIEKTTGDLVADLNHGNLRSRNIQICYRRGLDKPPLVEIGVYYEEKERLLPDIEVVWRTPYGRSASTGTSGSKSGTYITYRRAKTREPYNQMVVVDLCVILNNKSELPPHAFYTIKSNLNKSYYGMIGSEVFLCYKKTLLSPPSVCYKPLIISRFPPQDYPNFPLPTNVPLFCLPTGANIELWPVSNKPLRPSISTFVLTIDRAQKMYASSLTFYELFDSSVLTEEEKNYLYPLEDEEDRRNYEIYTNKSICIMSRWPFFECFEKFLYFLHNIVFQARYGVTNEADSNGLSSKRVPIEHYISHFLLDISFPTPERPKVLVQLMPGLDEEIIITQPSSSIPLPQTGANFIDLLYNLGVENTMNVLLFGLSEQKILLHSLRPWILTGVAEAISAMLFPFHWQCPYIPLCPLSLHDILSAPLPFIVGIDSRCFDTFIPPDDIICIDLDTSSIFLSESKRCLNLKILPKRASRVLRNSLEKISLKVTRLQASFATSNSSPRHRTLTQDAIRWQTGRKLELEIQEAFVRFMVTILKGFRSYLLPITRAPTIGTTDPTSLFNFEGFLSSRDRNYSQFYHFITKTQMFTRYIEERSFLSDKGTSLAFFDYCEEKLTSSDDIFSDKPIKLFEKDDTLIQNDRSVYIPAPEQAPCIARVGDATTISFKSSDDDIPERKRKFGPLRPELFHRIPRVGSVNSLDCTSNEGFLFPVVNENLGDLNNLFSIARRTKQEIRASQKVAKRSAESPLEWSKYLVSCCHCLWFLLLPSYIAFKRGNSSSQTPNQEAVDESNRKNTSRVLRHAFSTAVGMKRLELTIDEICFRVLTLLCSRYGQPALAVRVFFEMKKAGIKPNAVTYGYYNKAVLECQWPDHSSKPTTVLWTKIRNVISGITLFKMHGRIQSDKRARRFMPSAFSIGDPSFPIDTQPISSHQPPSQNHYRLTGNYVGTTTVPIDRCASHVNGTSEVTCGIGTNRIKAGHRRSLVNQSFSSFLNGSGNDLNKSMASQENLALDTYSKDLGHLRSKVQKSYSMQLRNVGSSPERHGGASASSCSSLEDTNEIASGQKIANIIDIKSDACSIGDTKAESSEDDDDDNDKEFPDAPLSRRHIPRPPSVGPVRVIPEANFKMFESLVEKCKLLVDSGANRSGPFELLLTHREELIDSSAGLLFVTTLNKSGKRTYASTTDHRTHERTSNLLDVIEEPDSTHPSLELTGDSSAQSLLRATSSGLVGAGANQVLTSQQQLLSGATPNEFGEDAQILKNLEVPHSQKPDFSDTILGGQSLNEALGELAIGHDDGANASTTTGETNTDERPTNSGSSGTLSQRDSDQVSSNLIEFGLPKNAPTTPNFKISDLISDTSHWSKWTSSQNSKSVYKGIKSAATGIVSSLQEIKSSFSIPGSNANTPAKLLGSAALIQPSAKSAGTRELISQWAQHYLFSSQGTRDGRSGDHSDASSIGSNDLMRLSNDEEGEITAANETHELGQLDRLFEIFSRHYTNNSGSSDDLLLLTSAIDQEVSPKSGADIDPDPIAMEVRISTCSICKVCHSLLYDEEIMERWSHNQSNLNTRCVYCRAKIVPLISVEVDDFRFPSTQPNDGSENQIPEEPKLIDLNCDETTPSSSVPPKSSNSSMKCAASEVPFIVPYLSPIVLRKELESVFDSSSDNSPARGRFVDEHPIIFWNLLWYAKRINMPTHLGLLCLSAQSILKGRQVPHKWASTDRVVIRSLWDNEKLHTRIGKPLYRLLERGVPSNQVEAILCDPIYFSGRFLNKVIQYIRANQLHKAMQLVLNERLRSSVKFDFDKNRHNLYRDLIFLTHRAIGSENLFMGNFEREYKKAFENLNFQHVALNRFDRPPTIGSVLCKRCFRELDLT